MYFARSSLPPAQLDSRPFTDHERQDGSIVSTALSAIRRHALLGVVVFLATAGAAAAYVLWRPPVYEVEALLSVDPKRSAVPDVYERLALQETEVGTEIELLRSRALAANVSDDLGLQVGLAAPRAAARGTYLDSVVAVPAAKRANYRLNRLADGTFEIVDRASGRRVGEVRPGGRAQLPASTASFTLRPEAAAIPRIDLSVVPRRASVEALVRTLRVDRPARDANEITVSLRSTDGELAAAVVNDLVDRFIAGQQGVEQSDARGAAGFLQEQADTLSRQLAIAEDSLRRFREATGFVRADEQANSQISRVVSLQADRNALDAERTSLASVVATVDGAHGDTAAPTRFRRLLAFPSFIKSPAASELLHSLTTLEDQRGVLLDRRTSVDPQVEALTDRINSVDEEIRSLAATYLEGLDGQIASMDTTLAQYKTTLRAIPANELTYGRLDRTVRVLSDAVTMLQTRLKEAQIAEDASDPSLRVVDQAVAPDRPVPPGRVLSLAAGMIAALVLALAACLLRAWADPKIRTSSQAFAISGVPVLGLIPSSRPSRGLFRRSSPAALPAALSSRIGSAPGATVAAVGAPSRVARMLPGRTIDRDVMRDAYARVDAHLSYSFSPNITRRVILVTSALAGDGKTMSALELARTAASNGRRVLLIDADLRRRGLTAQLGLPKSTGLSELLTGAVTDDGLVIHSFDSGGASSVDFVAAGVARIDPPEALNGPMFGDWLARVAGEYGAVILDSPPLIVPDAIVLSRLVDGVIVVVRSATTTGVALRSASEELIQARAPVIGIVLNDVDFSHPERYDQAAAYYGTSYSYSVPPR